MTVRILLTGVHGQLARSMAERADASREFGVACIGRPELDLERPETIERTVRDHQPDVIIGAAAYTAVDRAEDEPDLAMRLNGEAPGWLARAACTNGARFLQISTDYVFDGRKTSPYVESDPAAPQSAYGRTKLEGERRVLAEMPEAVILRTSWVYSPFGRNFVKTMLELAETRDRLTVVDDQHGNPTSALDLADACLAIIQTWRDAPTVGLGEIYHCAGSGETTWCGLACHTLGASRKYGGPFAEVTGITTKDWPTKAPRPANSRLDCTKLGRDFAWRAPDWRDSTEFVVHRLLNGSKTRGVVEAHSL